MKSGSVLDYKSVLVVDEDSIILDRVDRILDTCNVFTAMNFNTAIQYIMSYTIDILIINVGVGNSFDLLYNASVLKNCHTVILNDHAITPEAFNKSLQHDKISFFSRDNMSKLKSFLEKIVKQNSKSLWDRIFTMPGSYTKKHVIPDWEKQYNNLREFVGTVEESERLYN